MKHLKEELPVYLMHLPFTRIFIFGSSGRYRLFMKEYAKDNNLMLLSIRESFSEIIDGSDTLLFMKDWDRTKLYADEFQDTLPYSGIISNR